MKPRVTLEKDSSGYYVAEAPAFPGCLSQGRTPSEARANLREALTAWLSVMRDKVRR